MDLNTRKDETLLLLPEIASLHTATTSCPLLFLFNSGHTKLHMPVVLRLLPPQSLCECSFVFLFRVPDVKKPVPFLMYHLAPHLCWVWGTLTIFIFNKEYQAFPAAQDLGGQIHLQDLHLDRECCTLCDCNRWGDCNSWGKIIHLVVCYCDLHLIFS